MSTTQQDNLTEALVAVFQNSDAYRNLPPATKATINEIIRTSSAIYAPEIIKGVSETSNRQLDFIPKNLVGVNNPVDLVSSNIDSRELTNTLSPNVESEVVGDIAPRLASDIVNQLKNSTPPNTAQSIDFNSLNSLISNVAQIGVSAGVNTSLRNFTSGIFSGSIPVAPVLSNLTNIFSRDLNSALEITNQNYSATISKQALNESQRFNVNSEENQEKLITQTTGFIDPSATYPTKEYAQRAETNKLATGDVNGTIVQKKELARTRGNQLPNNESWEQPPIPFKGEYPYNKVIETESGHVIEMDDTPGAERLQVYHRSGTFIEIDSNGTIIKRTVGSSYEIVDKNGYISVSGDANLSVKGSIKIFVGGDANIEVEGDTNLKCHNDVTMQAAGKLNLSATEEVNITSANVNIEAYHTLNVKSEVALNASVNTDLNFKSNTNLFIQSPTFYNLSTRYFNQTGDMFEQISVSRYSQAGSQFHFKSGGTFNADGSQVYFNSGTSQGSQNSQAAIFAGPSKIGVIGTRKDITYSEIPDPRSPTHLDKYGYFAEDSELPSDAVSQQRRLKEIGILTRDDENQTGIEIERKSPASLNSVIVRPSDSLLSKTYLPDNYQLSTHFTLGMLSSKAVVTNNPVVAQLGLSYGQIVYNLQGVALNILEPLLSLYPNMFVTSAFRTASSSATTSDHPRGKAVDIQFRGVSKSDYYDIANNLATQLNYDKLLLEYKSYGTGLPWIHISFDVERPRKIVLTYFNDKKYGDGLISLA